MSFSIGDFFTDLGEDIWDEAGKLGKTIIPGLTAAGAGYLADQLQSVEASETKKAQKQMEALLNSPPSDPNSLGGRISAAFTEIGSAAGLRTYGPYILLGVVAIGVTAVLITRKG